ncbi:5'-nucleotidase C-terminal domain-containing protein [Neobacillus notoginsengisoli]|uniref:5'-nucleotidase C-terminal domain-containing protein n=1 Tax=Neobacillus notoginsengisoli TaxID=1578198 RepID=UPI001EFFB7C1|nr:5'-nucleotidase C-terminal domain-containing protein [Neobacillus notoginsengisoli]
MFNRSKKWISLVLTAVMLLALVVPRYVSANIEPVSLAKWDFSKGNNLVVTSGTPANADKKLSVTGASITGYNAGPTTGINVPNATPWTANPSYWQVSISTKGFENITLSSKQYSSNTGPRDFKVQYSLDNSTWVDVPGAAVTVAASWTSGGALTNATLPKEANDKDIVHVRWLKTSEIAANGLAIASGGTSRIGEIEFKGEAVQVKEPQPDPDAVPGEGKVVLGGEPLANLTFSLKNTATNQWHDYTSDANGVFTFNLADGSYKIEGLWVAPTWYPLGKTITIKNGLVDGLHALVLDGLNPAEGVWNVTGYVKNGSQTFNHLTFSLHSTDNKWYDATTDKNGKFNFNLPDGSYQVDGIWDGAAKKWYELNQQFTMKDGKLEGAAELIINIAGAFNVTGTLSKGTEAMGNTVFSLHTTTGEIKWYDTKTEANGNFELKLPNGSYRIDGIWDSAAAKWYELKKDFTVDGSLQLNIDVLKDGTGTVSPNVSGVLKKGNEVLPNVTFSVHTASGEEVWYDMTTDANGKFITTMPNGTYVLEGIWLNSEAKWYELKKNFVVNGVTEFNIDLLAGQPKEKFTLNIMHTNDTHANVDNATNKINVAKRMTAIKSVRADKPNALLLDAGDVFSGTLYFNEYKGLADLEFMNLAGYDAMTFGNHEFDMGTAVLADFVKGASFPFVSANVDFTNDANLQSNFHKNVTTDNAKGGQIYNGVIKVVDGEKVGIFGLTTAETPTISSPGEGVVFKNYIEEAQKSVDAFKAQGVNKIIALTHIGYNDSLAWDNDLELAKQVEGIDVIVGGHTHTKLDAPVIDNTGDEPTVIVQANEYNKFLGTVDVTFDKDGKVIVPETSGKLLDISTFAEDAATADLLNTKYKPAVTEKENTVVGTAAVPLVGGSPAARTGETNLGNFITDGMLAKAQTINPDTLIAVQNGGGIRVTLPAGNITLADVFKVLPFGNTLGIMNLKGSELREALEYSVKDAPTTAFGGFLQVSGLKVTYDSSKPAGQKIQSIEVKGKDGKYTAFDNAKNYYVATNVFTAKGGDGFTMFGKAYEEGRVSEPGYVDWEMFNDYIAAQPNKTVSPEVEGRIIDKAGQFTLNIMHTNDTHANVDNATNKINVAKKMTAIKSVRADKPSALLLDAGDVFSGTLYFNEFKGLADLKFMNLAGYDAMTFGNHEFDLGTAVLADFVKGANFPFVSANVDFTNDANLQSRFHKDVTTDNAKGGEIYNGIIKVVNGEKVGIFGLTTAETPTISSPGAGVVFKDYVQEAQKSVDAFKAQGVNKIIALTHIGYDDSLAWDNDLELAKQVEGIDVIVGGHTHTKLDAPVFDKTGNEPTVIVQANEYNKFLGTLNVTFDKNGKVIVPETTGKLLDISTYAEDAETLDLLNTAYKPAVTEKENTVVGTAAVELIGGNPPARVGETNLGNFIADGMLAKAQTINPDTLIAVQNGGGVRATLPAGNITLADVFKVLPFGNTLGIMNLKGSELRAALEYSVKDAPNAFGGFLQVSGLKVAYDSTKPAGEKIQSIEVKGKDGKYTALDEAKNYFVATNVFTAKGGDGFTMFGKAYTEGRVSEPGFVDWEMFNDFIAAQPNKTVNPQVEGRIINVAPQVIAGDKFSGTVDNPKVYNGNVIVDVTNVDKIENAIVKGNLTIKGGFVDIINVTVEGETLFED